MKNKTAWLGCLASAGLALSASGQVVTTFDNGTEGWSVSGRDDLSPVGGNPGANMDVLVYDVFGADIRNSTNEDFLGDYTAHGSFEMSVDIRIWTINMFGTEVTRELIVEFRDYDNDQGYPWTSVWLPLGVLDANAEGDNGDGWVTYSFTVEDPDAVGLPAGWGGYGYEDPVTFEPVLPPGRTFASVLASVDEIAFTTFVPGWFFGFTNFEMQVDNITLTPTGGSCPADTNGDGEVTAADFSAWIAAFNAGAPGCDQNGDGDCTAADFSAWVANFNAGC